VAAWLADLSWPAVVGVMALALAIAWLVEWVSWREAQARIAAPALEHQVVERAQALREPDPAPEPPPVVTTIPDPVAVEADPEPVPVPPQESEAPELLASEPAEAAPEPQTDKRRPEPEPDVEPEPDAAPEPEAAEAPARRTRRAWRGVSVRRVDPAEASTTGDPPAPAERDPVEAPEPVPATASELEPPAEVESRPAYAHPRAVPQPPSYEPAPGVPRVPANVVRMPRSLGPREWNIWELESLAREQARLEPERGEEWSYLFVHLRQFADARGKLPSEFDGLVRESFGELLETLEPA
jgi:hypothetical protein